MSESKTRILVAVDGSPEADLAFEVALEEAKLRNGELTVVSVVEPVNPLISKLLHSDSASQIDKYRTLVAAYVDRADSEKVTVKGHVGSSKRPGQLICVLCKER